MLCISNGLNINKVVDADVGAIISLISFFLSPSFWVEIDSYILKTHILQSMHASVLVSSLMGNATLKIDVDFMD